MAAAHGQMSCMIYPSAFSGEVVFQVNTASGDYEGVAPKHYVEPNDVTQKIVFVDKCGFALLAMAVITREYLFQTARY